MAKRISELEAASSVAGTDQFELNQGGTSRRATRAQVVDGLAAAAHTHTNSDGVVDNSAINMQGKLLDRPHIKNVADSFFDAGNVSGAVALDYANGGWQRIRLTGNLTSLTMTNWPTSGRGGFLLLEVLQDGTGNRTWTPGSAFKWPGGTVPTLSTVADALDVFTFATRDAGTTILSFEGGKAFA